MTNQTIPPCPVCGKVPEVVRFLTLPAIVTGCEHIALRHQTVEKWESACNKYLGRAFRELGIETVEQLRELVGIACDACDERTVRATNRAENLVPLLRRRAGEG